MRVHRGFSLMELLVVMFIIALLISMLLPAVNNARQQAISLRCMANMRQLGFAATMYINENHGWLASSDTCGPDYQQNFVLGNVSTFPVLSRTQTWVGWVDGLNLPDSISNGTLWRYVRNAELYKCPADYNIYRARTYSMNAFFSPGMPSGIVPDFAVYKISQIRNATGTIAFAEECASQSAGSGTSMQNQWNKNGWLQFPLAADSMTPLVSTTPVKDTWGGLIASWHRGGANFTFLDGHAEYWKFSDKRTVNYLKNDPTWPNPYYYTPGDPDLIRIKKGIVTWNVQATN